MPIEFTCKNYSERCHFNLHSMKRNSINCNLLYCFYLRYTCLRPWSYTCNLSYLEVCEVLVSVVDQVLLDEARGTCVAPLWPH